MIGVLVIRFLRVSDRSPRSRGGEGGGRTSACLPLGRRLGLRLVVSEVTYTCVHRLEQMLQLKAGLCLTLNETDEKHAKRLLLVASATLQPFC